MREPLPSAELYDPAAGIWSATSSTTGPRAYHTATLLPSGKVLAAGGKDDQFSSGASSAEILDISAAGSICTEIDGCVSGFCNDGVCCAAACSGLPACMTCKPATGACVPVTGKQDADTCTGASSCDATGACKLKVGQPCPDGDGTCSTGFCADGFCCDQACNGGCDTCGVAGKEGTCTVVTAAKPGNAPSCAPYV